VRIRGAIRVAQTQIYGLHTLFDTDHFRLDHMGTKYNGKVAEEYFERASEVNNWRSMIDLETDRIVATAKQFIGAMKPRVAKLSKDEFIAHPDYVVFCSAVMTGGMTFQAPTKRLRTD